MAHPNKINVERFRLWDKEFNLQEWFGKREYGTLKKARAAAELRQIEVNKAKRAAKLRRQLSISILFADDGSVKGLRKYKRVRDDRQEDEHFFDYQVRAIKNRTERGYASLNKYDFDTAYRMITDKLLATHGIESTPEIRQQFKKAKRYYL